ncbi:UPF0187 protein [Diplonema papillatum]|nr:UPF0187 protein [Diplonema papillatum]|eukprot:gene10094-15516_t
MLDKGLINPYGKHPGLVFPDDEAVSVLTPALKKRIAGTADQMQTSKVKMETARYREDGWRVLFAVRGTLFTNSLLPALLVAALSAALAGLHLFFDKWIRFHDTPHTLAIMPVALMLVFRSNFSYDRWLTGRTAIGQFVFASRCLVIKGPSCLCGPQHLVKQQSEKVARIVMATMIATRHSVQSRPSEEKTASVEEKAAMTKLRCWELRHYLMDAEMRQVRESAVPVPLTLNRLLYATLVEPLSPNSRVQYKWCTAVDDLAKHAGDLLAAWQGMMKIANTSIPFVYVHTLEAVLTIWIATLPFALLDERVDMGWLTVPICMILAVLLFGINNVGKQIEDPFGNSPNDFDLVNFQTTLHNEFTGLIGKEPWATNEPFADEARG